MIFANLPLFWRFLFSLHSITIMGVNWFTIVVACKKWKRRFLWFLVISLIFIWLGDIVFVLNFSCKFSVFACICCSFCCHMTDLGQWKIAVNLYWGRKDSHNNFIWCVMFLISSNLIVFLKKCKVVINFCRFCSFLADLLPSRIEEKSHISFQKVPVNQNYQEFWS